MTNKEQILALKNSKLENHLDADKCPKCRESLTPHNQTTKYDIVYFAKCHSCGYQESLI